MDGGSKHVDPFIYAFVAYDLGTQKAAGTFFKNYFHGHQHTAGIVAGMAHGGEDDFIHVQPGFPGICLVNTGGGCGQVAYFDHGTALRTGIAAVFSADIVRGDPSLSVGGPCQREQGILSGYIVFCLYGIAYSIYVGD